MRRLCRQLAQTSLINFTPWNFTSTSTLGPPLWGAATAPIFSKLLQAAAIQEAVKASDLANREQLRKRNVDDLEQQAKGKKGKALLINNINEMEDCGPTSSFGAAYDKQLELESVRVDTERRSASAGATSS